METSVPITNVDTRSVADGRILSYTVCGSGPHPLLFVPGALGLGMADHEPLIALLDKQKYTIIAVDLFGYSATSVERDWNIDANFEDARDCHATMMSLGYGYGCNQSESESGSGSGSGRDMRYSVLGWCYGATTAMIIAAQWPNSVRNLVIWGGKAYINDDDMKRYIFLRDFDNWQPEARKRWIVMFGEARARKIWDGRFTQVERIYKERNGDICKTLLPKISARTLVLHGELDALLPEEHATYVRKNIPKVQFHSWADGKHILQLQYTKQFIAVVKAFLEVESR